jgi:hypothetical protein
MGDTSSAAHRLLEGEQLHKPQKAKVCAFLRNIANRDCGVSAQSSAKTVPAKRRSVALAKKVAKKEAKKKIRKAEAQGKHVSAAKKVKIVKKAAKKAAKKTKKKIAKGIVKPSSTGSSGCSWTKAWDYKVAVRDTRGSAAVQKVKKAMGSYTAFPIVPFMGAGCKPRFNECSVADTKQVVCEGKDKSGRIVGKGACKGGFRYPAVDRFGCVKCRPGEMPSKHFVDGTPVKTIKNIFPNHVTCTRLENRNRLSCEPVFTANALAKPGTALPVSCIFTGLLRASIRVGDVKKWNQWSIGCVMWKHVYCVTISGKQAARRCSTIKRIAFGYADTCSRRSPTFSYSRCKNTGPTLGAPKLLGDSSERRMPRRRRTRRRVKKRKRRNFRRRRTRFARKKKGKKSSAGKASGGSKSECKAAKKSLEKWLKAHGQDSGGCPEKCEDARYPYKAQCEKMANLAVVRKVCACRHSNKSTNIRSKFVNECIKRHTVKHCPLVGISSHHKVGRPLQYYTDQAKLFSANKELETYHKTYGLCANIANM